MTLAELLADLDRLGVRLVPRGDRLRFYPAEALTSAHVAALREHKAAILAAITIPPLVRDLLTDADRAGDGTTAFRLIGCGFPAHPIPEVDPRVVAARRIRCPNCVIRHVLPELARMTKGLCYTCWESQSDR